MKSKIIGLFLAFLLSISLTACSNNTSSSTPDSKSESTKTQLTSKDNKALALDAYKEVLLNKAEFFSNDNNKNVYINDFLTNKEIYGTVFTLSRFTVLDMDNDEIPEVVLELKVDNHVEFYEVLHYMNDKVNGNIQVQRGFRNLKTDGTMSYSNSAFNNGYMKLSFEANSSEAHILGYHDTENKDNVATQTYFIDNKPVTQEAYNAFTKAQEEKKDAVWYKFSEGNIEAVINDYKSSTNPENNNDNQKTEKQKYKEKLDKIQLVFDGFDAAAAPTNDMYQEEIKEHKEWDDELNKIYGILKGQLSQSDMKKLQNEEIQWIKDRDAKAKKDSEEMAGGSMEKVLYEGSLVKSTRERCYELVDKYMK
ncbi:lysozyme inhibitor LprI family protein [Clostridium sp. C2-6-12]|uniref:lysozyme inhibitor LprI family protein n=1 Tax=Clostridium sp. C2-6-12 TaxID=2698832 RepID=UPI0013679E53|nr:lysozyme inhibitor LprI family protein [Clostridium sp. C2-6-12]